MMMMVKYVENIHNLQTESCYCCLSPRLTHDMVVSEDMQLLYLQSDA